MGFAYLRCASGYIYRNDLCIKIGKDGAPVEVAGAISSTIG